MRKIIKIMIIICALLLNISLFSCSKDNNNNNDNFEIIKENNKKQNTHYLKFVENNSEVLRIVVSKDDTYESLFPFFPTLDAKEGYVVYWDGDYRYTEYSSENQFTIYDENTPIIEIYAYMKKA